MIIVFAVELGWLPGRRLRALPRGPGREPRAHAACPRSCSGSGLSAVLMRQMRSAMLDSLGADYVRTARAKGLSEWSVVGGHALRNSLITVTTVIGLAARRADLGRGRHRADLRHRGLRPADGRRDRPARLRAAPGRRARRGGRVRRRQPRSSTSSTRCINPRIRVAGTSSVSAAEVEHAQPRVRARRRACSAEALPAPAARGRRRSSSSSRSSSRRSSRRGSRRTARTQTDFDAVLGRPVARAPARHRRPRPRHLLAHHLRRAGLDPGGLLRHGARDGHRRAVRPRRRLLPRLGRHGDLPRHGRAARVPVPDPRRRARRDPRPVAAERDDRARHRGRRRRSSGSRAARRSRCARRTTSAAAVANGAGDATHHRRATSSRT